MPAAGVARASAIALICVMQAFGTTSAPAQTLSSRPLTIVSPFATGASTDFALRVIAQKIGDAGGPKVVIDSRPGGAGVIAANAVKTALPDGTSVLFGNVGILASNVSLIANLSYDPLEDFAPVTLLFSQPSVLAVPASLPVGSVSDLIALAKSRPKGLSYAGQSVGSSGHLLGAMLAKAAGVQMTLVPYRGAAPAVTDLLAGRVDLFFTSYATVHRHVEAGTLKLLAITTPEREPLLPQTPTVAEVGFPELEMDIWYGLAAPARTPPPVVQALHASFTSAASSPEVVAQLRGQGMRVVTSTPAELKTLIVKEVDRYRTIMRELDVKPE
jgi:tripartite-type tricarboxylate transporter receptor subunit TctC